MSHKSKKAKIKDYANPKKQRNNPLFKETLLSFAFICKLNNCVVTAFDLTWARRNNQMCF